MAEWFTDEFVAEEVDSFVNDLDRAFDPWRQEYTHLWRERRRLHQLIGAGQGDYQDQRERDAIEDRLEDMRSGGMRFNTYYYLRTQGFLPNYGFPRNSTTLTFTSSEDDIQRDQTRAIKEFAPGNYVYYDGERFSIRYARPRTEDADILTRHIRVCSECEAILMGEDAQQAAACRSCGASFGGMHTNVNAMELPDQHATPDQNITSDEEERRRQGYDINHYYEQTDDVEEYELVGEGFESHVTYEPNASIVIVNSGLRDSDDDDLDGFAICTECKRWLTSTNQIEKHVGDEDDGQCYANASGEDIRRNIELYTEGGHDTVTLTTPILDSVDTAQAEAFYTTLKEALYQGILVAFDLDEEELETFAKPAAGEYGQVTIVVYETSEGGAGALHALMDDVRIRQVVREALTVIHETPDASEDEGCERACYERLMSFYNQPEHELLDRTLVTGWLERLGDPELETLPSADEGPDRDLHFEELHEACDSPFEENVLEAIRDGGFDLPDEAQHTIYDDGEPVARADFFYERPGSSIAVFVDGPDHEKDYVKEDDERKRNRLKQMNYRVIPVTSVDQVPEVWSKI